MGFKTIRYEQPVKHLFTLRPNIAHLSNLNSVHVNKVAFQFNNAMSLITGMVRSTPFQWLSNIAMPWLRCEVSLFRELKHCWSILFDQLQVVPSIQLRSRSEIWTIDPARWLLYRGRKSWLSNVRWMVTLWMTFPPVPPRFDLKRQKWVILCALDA
jgi:hypothetical protein